VENSLVVDNKELRYYNQMAGSFTISHLQSSLSKKCDDLIDFQKKVIEQMELVLNKLAHK